MFFSSIEKMLNNKPTTKFPSHNKPRDLAERFVSFFVLKVQPIRSNFPPISLTLFPEEKCYSDLLSKFSPTSTRELVSLIKSGYGKACALDPIPGFLMRECCYETLLHVLTFPNHLQLFLLALKKPF